MNTIHIKKRQADTVMSQIHALDGEAKALLFKQHGQVVVLTRTGQKVVIKRKVRR